MSAGSCLYPGQEVRRHKTESTFPTTQPFKNVTNCELTQPGPDVDMVMHGLHSVVCHF